ncbi:MAG: TonB-dependent receptor [Flavobacteriales bacterium]|nr:TonB-dependent receptor [Flavobacteriales bacterium]
MFTYIYKWLPALLIFIGPVVHAQTPIEGRVLEKSEEGSKPAAILFANVYWAGTQTGTATDADGHFSIPQPSAYPAHLVVSHIQYGSDTITLSKAPSEPLQIYLTKSTMLQVVEKIERRNTTDISTLDSRGVQYITSAELQKAPCCNLSESFETNAAVDVVYSDAVSGAKKIQMLGLDGIYTQIQLENIPLIRGMGAAYGLSFVPGPWIESISINKGTGSVLNGFESMTGQINLAYVMPGKGDRYFINLFGNHQGRMEFNGHLQSMRKSKWKAVTLAHASYSGMKVDNNGDGFLDMPTGQQVNLMQRWKYQYEKMEGQLAGQFMDWHTLGGQTTYNPDLASDSTNGYGVDVHIRQYGAFSKNGFLMPSHHDHSLGLITSVRRTEQTARFGNRTYDGSHNSGYFNSIFQVQGHHHNLLKTGVSLQVDDYKETFVDSIFNSTAWAAGPFVEYSIEDSDRFSMIGGLRADYHNLYGIQVTPRLHVRWSPWDLTALRISAGRGFRNPHLFMENPAIFASSRKLVITGDPGMEDAWTIGVSLTRKFTLFGRKASLNADHYYTVFINQAVIDLDRNVHEIVYGSLNGTSRSHSSQVELTFEPLERLTCRLSARRYDVQTTTAGHLQSRALVPKNRGMMNLAWESRNGKWQIDFTMNAFGTTRIPGTETNPNAYRRDNHSPRYVILHSQVSKEFKWFRGYIGVENLTNYTQPDPIIGSDAPFGPYFDGSLIWGPLNGRSIYAGIRTHFN